MTDTISVKQLREEFPKIRKALKKGNNFILIYHSQPLAQIFPYPGTKKKHKGAIEWLANLPQEALFRSQKSSVEIVRELRGTL